MLFRGQGEKEVVAKEVVVQRQLPETVALVCHAQDTWKDQDESNTPNFKNLSFIVKYGFN